MYSNERLLILDADGTTIDAFTAIERTFRAHGMNIGALERFQKRRHLFKYLGGLKEFPANLKRQLGRQSRARLIDTLTEVYRDEAGLYAGIGEWLNRLIAEPGLRVGVVTRNITHRPVETLGVLLARHGVAVSKLDFMRHVPLKHEKTAIFRELRERYEINPARCYVCGDEKHDFHAALSTGMHPFMVAYGFEDLTRLIGKIGVPAELISKTPTELVTRVSHALQVPEPLPMAPPIAWIAPTTVGGGFVHH
jgi:phosphoglycolate phosphatase